MRSTDAKNELIIGKEYSSKVLKHIQNARSSIYILIFDWRWYSRDVSSDMSLINNAILRASQKGVVIKVFCNYASMCDQLKKLGIDAKCWTKTKLMHAKGILIDEDTLILGSHNLTQSALTLNVEVSAVLYDKDVCIQFKKYFLSFVLSVEQTFRFCQY